MISIFTAMSCFDASSRQKGFEIILTTLETSKKYCWDPIAMLGLDTVSIDEFGSKFKM